MRTVTYDEMKWKLVPVTGSLEMIDAFKKEMRKASSGTGDSLRAAIAAAPDHPATAMGTDDAARLEWVLRHTPGDALRYSVGVLADTADLSEFRAAIDAAMRASKGGE